MSKRMVQFSIYRYDPDKDDAPYMQDISVELEPTDRKLLDALTKLKLLSYMSSRIGEELDAVITGARVELRTDVVTRTPSAKDYSQGHRLYGLVDTRLLWTFDMAAVGQPLVNHLAATLTRDSAFLAGIQQDPLLGRVKLIAEPWDIGPGGYQLGAYPPPFAEWNDKFRDGVRRFWRGDAGMAPELSRRLLGSADKFDHSRRPATSSVNFITSHDGFTLEDLVTYTVKRNLANGEENRDGHDDNHADNMGVEGPSENAAIRTARDLRKRNLLATLLLSQGTPMLLAGDELGHSQDGNNNEIGRAHV